MTISPTPLPPDATAPVDRVHTRAQYDWGSIVFGQWQRWLTITDEVTNADAMRQATRIRVAAKWHADRHGYRLESRRINYGRILDLRFTRQ